MPAPLLVAFIALGEESLFGSQVVLGAHDRVVDDVEDIGTPDLHGVAPSLAGPDSKGRFVTALPAGRAGLDSVDPRT